MPAQWTVDVVGEMHRYHITGKQLAETMGWNPKYLSTVLNGRREPRGAEQKCRRALDVLILEQTHDSTQSVQ